MKNFLALVALLSFTFSASAQLISDVSTGITLSPFVTATKILETTAVGAIAAVQSTRSVVQSRGVAGKEQLMDELMVFNEAMAAGRIKVLADFKEAGLRELFEEIMADEEQMKEINLVVNEGPDLYRIATVVTIILLTE